MDYRITYTSPTGDVITDTAGNNDVFIEADSLDGFAGQVEDTGVATIGVPGETVDFNDRRILPTEGTLTLVVTSAEAWARARRAFSTTAPGTLTVEASQRCILPVRLAQPLPSPTTRPRTGSRIEVSLIRSEGAWLIPATATAPTVTITNTGETPIAPRILWKGSGGKVALPSGAEFTLPPVTTTHTLYFSRHRAGQVYTPNGVVDKQLTTKTAAVAERVPPDTQRVYRIPEGAHMQWETEVFDPWI